MLNIKKFKKESDLLLEELDLILQEAISLKKENEILKKRNNDVVLKNIISYICNNYDCGDNLQTLTSLIYLADWKNCLEHGACLTNLEWHYGNRGPETKGDIPKPNKCSCCDLKEQDIAVLDHVIRVVKKMERMDFIRLLYSTYPMISSNRYDKLDLVQKVSEYKNKSYMHSKRD